MRAWQLRRLVAIGGRISADPQQPTAHRERTRVYANRADRRARVDDPELVPPELARRPPLSDGEDA